MRSTRQGPAQSHRGGRFGRLYFPVIQLDYSTFRFARLAKHCRQTVEREESGRYVKRDRLVSIPGGRFGQQKAEDDQPDQGGEGIARIEAGG